MKKKISETYLVHNGTVLSFVYTFLSLEQCAVLGHTMQIQGFQYICAAWRKHYSLFASNRCRIGCHWWRKLMQSWNTDNLLGFLMKYNISYGKISIIDRNQIVYKQHMRSIQWLIFLTKWTVPILEPLFSCNLVCPYIPIL